MVFIPKTFKAEELAANMIRLRAIEFEKLAAPVPADTVKLERKFSTISAGAYLLEQLIQENKKAVRELLAIFKMRDSYIHPLFCPAILRSIHMLPSLSGHILSRMDNELVQKIDSETSKEDQIYIKIASGSLGTLDEIIQVIKQSTSKELKKTGLMPVPKLWRQGGEEVLYFFLSLSMAKKKVLANWYVSIETNQGFWDDLRSLFVKVVSISSQGVFSFNKAVELTMGEKYEFLENRLQYGMEKRSPFEIFAILPEPMWREFFQSHNTTALQLLSEEKMSMDLLSVYLMVMIKVKEAEELSALMQVVIRKKLVFERMGTAYQILGYEAFNSYIEAYLETATNDFLTKHFDTLFDGSPHNLNLKNSETIMEQMLYVEVEHLGLNHPSLTVLRKNIIYFLHPNIVVNRNKIWGDLYFKDRHSFQFWSEINFQIRRRRHELLHLTK